MNYVVVVVLCFFTFINSCNDFSTSSSSSSYLSLKIRRHNIIIAVKSQSAVLYWKFSNFPFNPSISVDYVRIWGRDKLYPNDFYSSIDTIMLFCAMLSKANVHMYTWCCICSHAWCYLWRSYGWKQKWSWFSVSVTTVSVQHRLIDNEYDLMHVRSTTKNAINRMANKRSRMLNLSGKKETQLVYPLISMYGWRESSEISELLQPTDLMNNKK